jgi:hypothetical protein
LSFIVYLDDCFLVFSFHQTPDVIGDNMHPSHIKTLDNPGALVLMFLTEVLHILWDEGVSLGNCELWGNVYAVVVLIEDEAAVVIEPELEGLGLCKLVEFGGGFACVLCGLEWHFACADHSPQIDPPHP